MATWNEIFGVVLRDSGVVAQGQTPNNQMMNDLKTRANMLLSQWKRRRWLVYHLIDTSVVCDGSLFYTLGPGQQFDVPRIDQLEAAFARQLVNPAPSGQVDFPLQIIGSMEDYSTITLKQMQAGPAWAVFYDSGYPFGKVYPWPLMNNQFELHLIIKSELTSVDVLTDDIVLPPEYHLALYNTLINMTRAAFRLPADPYYIGQAKASLETLRSSNFQIRELAMPLAVLPVNGSNYNVYSDSFGPRRT